MIYRTCEHYYENENELVPYVKPEEECFVCFEIYDDTKSKPINLRYQFYYRKSCTCDGYIHKKCFDIWYNGRHTCPICRIEIHEIINGPNDLITFIKISNLLHYSIKLFNFLYFLANRFIIIFSVLATFFSILEHFISVSIAKSIINNDCLDPMCYSNDTI
jgi:hypothetical protein